MLIIFVSLILAGVVMVFQGLSSGDLQRASLGGFMLVGGVVGMRWSVAYSKGFFR